LVRETGRTNRVAVLSRDKTDVYAIVVCLSVCHKSVFSVLLKRLNVGSRK